MTVEAVLNNTQECSTQPMYQYDQGQKIHLSGIDLPASYLAEFSNEPYSVAEQIAQTTDTVTVPDKYLTSGKPVFVWIVVVDNAGRTTRYAVFVPVKERGEPANYTPSPSEQTAIEAAISALEDTAEELTDMIAPEFVQATANQAGTYVINSDDLYELPNGHTANATWANTTKTQTTVSAEFKKLKDADTELMSAFEKQRRKFIIGNPSSTLTRTNHDNTQDVITGIEKTELLNRFDALIDSIEAINYDGCVSVGRFELLYYAKTVGITLCFYDDPTTTYEPSDINEAHKIHIANGLNTLMSNDLILYTGVSNSNIAVRVKFNPSIVSWLNSLQSNEHLDYNALSADMGCSIDGFIPQNVTNEIFTNYPAFKATANAHFKWLFSFNDAIKDITIIDGMSIGSIEQFSESSGTLYIGFRYSSDDGTQVIPVSGSTAVSATLDLSDFDDVFQINLAVNGYTYCVSITIDKTKIVSGVTFGSTGFAGNTKATCIPVNIFKNVEARKIYSGYINDLGNYVSDNDYSLYIVPINPDCKKAVITTYFLEHGKVALCNENGTIHQIVSPDTSSFACVDCSGYYYIAFACSRVTSQKSVMVENYDEKKAIRSIIGLKKILFTGSKNIGSFNITRTNDGRVYTNSEKSIFMHPFFEVEEQTAQFTNPANSKVYSNNCLMEICKDGTKYYIATREDGALDNYFFPIIWKQKGDSKSLVLGTNSDNPEDAVIYQGDGYPDLSGVKWLERSNNTLYQQMDSITELSNGELLICLAANIPDNGVNYFSTVVFVTAQNRTIWVPRFICTNQRYTYSGTPYSVIGYPTKNNSIQVFKTKYDTSRDCILISEYGAGTPQYWKEQGIDKNGNGVVGKVWMSVNNGQTFKKIFDLDEKINGDADDTSDNNWKWCKSYKGRMASHLHSAYYDAVNEMVWITNGDAGTEDGRNTLFYMHIHDLFGWCSTQGTAVSPLTLHPTYTDNEALPSFMQYIMTEQGRDVSYTANALSQGVNFQMYSMYATEKALILGNDTARRIMFGVHNTCIDHADLAQSTDLFVDMFQELDESNPVTVLSGMPETFYRRDENSPLLCFYSKVGVFASWDGVNWINLFATGSGTKYIGFTTHVCEDTDGKPVFVYKGEGTPECHNWKINNY